MLKKTITEDLVVDDLHKEALREAQRREESATKDMAIAKSLRAREAVDVIKEHFAQQG